MSWQPGSVRSVSAAPMSSKRGNAAPTAFTDGSKCGGFPLRQADGQIALWYLLQTDIDDRKRAEALLTGEKQLLEMVASGHPMPAVLSALCPLRREHGRRLLLQRGADRSDRKASATRRRTEPAAQLRRCHHRQARECRVRPLRHGNPSQRGNQCGRSRDRNPVERGRLVRLGAGLRPSRLYLHAPSPQLPAMLSALLPSISIRPASRPIWTRASSISARTSRAS